MSAVHRANSGSEELNAKVKKALVPVLAGGIAGGMEILLIWPMEVMKTNLQLGTHRQHYSGLWQGFRYHFQTHGPISLYRGMVPVLFGSIPKAATRFGAFEFFKKNVYSDKDGNITIWGNLAAGLSAGAVEAALTTTPVETMKTKLIDANVGVWQGLKRIIATEGIQGLYQGLTATVMRQATSQGLRFMWFGEYKKRIGPALERANIVRDYNAISPQQAALVSLVGGMSAGTFSVLGNNPFDVVKTRMQGLGASRYKNTLDCAVQVYRYEGVRAFYTGIVPRLGRVIPGQGIMFMTFDSIKGFVSKHL